MSLTHAYRRLVRIAEHDRYRRTTFLVLERPNMKARSGVWDRWRNATLGYQFLLDCGRDCGRPAEAYTQGGTYMKVWKGWTATASAPTMRALTWAEWCAWQGRTPRYEPCRRQNEPFSDRELAYLSFLRWLCQTGHLDPQENDNVRTHIDLTHQNGCLDR
jgi:hypothetical protein